MSPPAISRQSLEEVFSETHSLGPLPIGPGLCHITGFTLLYRKLLGAAATRY
jgi:hypothetical protein